MFDGPNSGFCLFAICFLEFLIFVRAWWVYYDLYLHPLAHIPGPKLAATTYLYQTYFSLIGGSRFYIQIGKLHEKYGPVVRITPDEVHLSDPENYEAIYYIGSKYSKSPPYYNSMSCGVSTFSALSNEEHRVKRSRINPFFSRKKVLELEHSVQARAQKLCAIIAKKLARNEAVDVHYGFRAVSVDVITAYAFNQCFDLLGKEDLGMEFFFMMQELGPMMWIFQQWPFVQKIALSMPQAISAAMGPPMKQLFDVQAQCRKLIASVKSDMEAGRKLESQTTIFHDLLTADPKQGYIVPSLDHLKDEAYTILGAAADTAGGAMSVAAYEVISDPVKYQRLSAELKAAFPDPNAELDFLTLEKLTYLTGIVKEGIRLSFGSPGRLPRVVPESGATFNGFYLPPGYFVSMGTWELHHNEDYFPNATKFDPDRWADPLKAKRMEKAYVPFGKGQRMCVGINLAYCEIYVTLGTLFRRFDNLKANHLEARDQEYEDYISSKHPLDATRFHLSAGEKVV